MISFLFYFYRCKRYKCYENISREERERIFNHFYSLEGKNIQDTYISGLITVETIKQRRPRKSAGHNNSSGKDLHSASFYYKIRVLRDDVAQEVPVCRTAFLNIHATTKARLRYIQQSLVNTASAPADQRGKYQNRPKTIPVELKLLVNEHIESFAPRKSHYSLRKNPNRSYLPENLSVKQMYRMFLGQYRINIPYQSYWSIFHKEYNIKFGVPRSDTCTVCDMLKRQISACTEETQQKRLKFDHTLHLKKADTFVKLKKQWKQKSREGSATVLSFDYMQNLPLPHIQTNTVFYCRQLWLYVFGVHNLSDDSASMYLYHEGIGKKGQNDVTSLLFHHLKGLENPKEHLVLFSDGCSGQNKNYVMVHFLYMLVHCLKMFKQITYIFPIRGHSYLPNDQDFAIISKRKRKEAAETPAEWIDIISGCRESPSPFNVVNVERSMFFNIKEATDPYFLKTPKPAVALKNLRMYRIQEETSVFGVRDHYNSAWRSCIIRNKKKLPRELHFKASYPENLPINRNKMKDLRKLFDFIKKESLPFYEQLQSTEDPADDIDHSDNSSGDEA